MSEQITLKQHIVRWEIEVDAAAPEDAAKLALQIMQDPDSTATVFTVTDGRTDHRVDLMGSHVDELERDNSDPAPGWMELGAVGVDSGQLLITDPCYIDTEWVKEDFIPNHPLFALNEKGRERFPVLYTGGPSDDWTWQCFRDGSNYGTPLADLGAMSINTARDEGLLEVLPQPEKPEPTPYSYNGCCAATLGDPGYGQLQYRMGHDGVGVAFASGYGDGHYPVYGRINKNGRVVEVRIVMD